MKKVKKLLLLPLALLPYLLFLWLYPRQPAPPGEELLTNGSFADVTEAGMPSAWYTEAYTRSAGYTDFALVQEDDGRQALFIVNHLPNDAHIVLLQQSSETSGQRVGLDLFPQLSLAQM